MATQRIRKELLQHSDKESQLQMEIQQLQQQLSDANHGLNAASRLSDQLEACQQTINVLREEGKLNSYLKCKLKIVNNRKKNNNLHYHNVN